MRSFIISPDQIDGNKIRCSASEQKHITTVLRMQQGNQVRFFDGTGNIILLRLNVLMKTISLLRLSIKDLILKGYQASLYFKD